MSNKQCHCSQCIRFVLKEVQSYQFDVIDTGESNQKPKYCIAENFRGRKLSWILRFCGYSRKFFPWNSGVWRPLAWQQRAIRESFLCENCIFHQFAKVFSLESFPLYGMSWSPTCITDRQTGGQTCQRGSDMSKTMHIATISVSAFHTIKRSASWCS